MFQTIRGTFDILPDGADSAGSPVPSTAAWLHAETVVREIMARYAFEEIRTPILEPLDLIARGVGGTTDIVQKEMFTVERSKETYVLRPEVTAPVMRAYLQHALAQRGGAQRLFYVGPCFRAERPQKGRYRQFHQFGTELLGSADPRADVDVIANLRAIYDAFGVTGTRLRLNSIGDAEDRPRYRDALRDYFAPHADVLSETSRTRLESNPLRILDTKVPAEIALLADAPVMADFLGSEAADHHGDVKELLASLDIPFFEDPLLVRGLDYYTRTVFELESDALGAQGALGAGGRYDGLAEAVGSKSPVPAVGYAAGFERLFIALAAQGIVPATADKPDAFIVALGEDAERVALSIAQSLRTNGRSVDFSLDGKSMKAQMKAADRSGAGLTLILGQDEITAGTVIVRDMKTREQTALQQADVPGALNARLQFDPAASKSGKA